MADKVKVTCPNCEGTGKVIVKIKEREEIDQVLGTDKCACGKCSACLERIAIV